MRAILILLLALAACGAPEQPGPDPFTATGELIALSGGDAGPQSACIGCHGLSGEGNGAGAPRLAGLGVGYLGRQMEFFAAGLRQHPEMQRIAERLSQGERQMVAGYYADLQAPPRSVGPHRSANRLYHVGDPSRGLPSCASCHGDAGEGAGLGNPPLAGQPATYLAGQLEAWRNSKRRGDPMNQMLRISQALTPQEIRSVAAYASGLPGDAPRPGYAGASLQARRDDPRNDASAPRRYEAAGAP